MTHAAAPRTQVKLYGLVRDAEGRPVVDDPSTLPPPIIAMLTPQEREELGVSLPDGYGGEVNHGHDTP